MAMLRRALLLLALVLPAASAAAQDLVALRTGRHAGFDRIVLEWSETAWYSIELGAGSATIRLVAPVAGRAMGIGGLRNLAGVAGEGRVLRLALRDGVVLRHYRLDNRIVLDLMDPARRPAPETLAQIAVAAELPAQDAGTAAPAARRPARPPRKPRRPPAPAIAAPALPPLASEAVAAPVSAAPVEPPRAEDAVPADPPPAPRAVAAPAEPPVAPRPAPVAAAPRPAAVSARERRLVVPAPASTAAAVIRRGDLLVAAFDTPDPIDLDALRADPAFARAEIDAKPNALVLMIPLDPLLPVRVRRDARAWVLELGGAAAGAALPIEPEADAATARLFLPALQPGRVVPVRDPETGMPLLLGTVRQQGQAVATDRRLPELDILRTSLGAAVLARSDAVAMQTMQDRFAIAVAGSGRFALDRQVTEPAAAPSLTRSFDFPAQPPGRVLDRLKALQSGIAAAPPFERVPQRRSAAEALIALGMPQEAQAMLALGYAEDPRAGGDPLYRALSGIAALLAGRIGETAGLGIAELPETDEIRLWRAALAAEMGNPKAAAQGFGATLPLLLAYPKPLQLRLVPLAAQALGEAGDAATLKRLVAAAPAELDLGLAKAVLIELAGKPAEALAAYDAVAKGRDRLARSRALRRAAELRLAAGSISQLEAAKALEASLFAWRGGDEVATRIRIAELRLAGGDPRAALALLQETAELFPDSAAAIRPVQVEAFATALAREPPLAAVALHDAYPELLPGGERGDAVLETLALRLAELDLGERAAALLRPAVQRATGARRAALGLSLANLRMAEGDLTEAGRVLAETAAPGLAPPLALERAVLGARIEARQGRGAEAIARLRALGPPAAEPLAELLAEAQDWPGAAAALAEARSAGFPAAPAALEETQRRLLLREAALLALAGDEPGLAALRKAELARMRDGPLADAFALLTADPLKGLGDLTRLQRELQIFRRFPTRLEALRNSAPVTR